MHAKKIVKARVVLHNYLQKEEDIAISMRKYCPTGFADTVDENSVFHFGDWRKAREGALKGIGRIS